MTRFVTPEELDRYAYEECAARTPSSFRRHLQDACARKAEIEPLSVGKSGIIEVTVWVGRRQVGCTATKTTSGWHIDRIVDPSRAAFRGRFGHKQGLVRAEYDVAKAWADIFAV